MAGKQDLRSNQLFSIHAWSVHFMFNYLFLWHEFPCFRSRHHIPGFPSAFSGLSCFHYSRVNFGKAISIPIITLPKLWQEAVHCVWSTGSGERVEICGIKLEKFLPAFRVTHLNTNHLGQNFTQAISLSSF